MGNISAAPRRNRADDGPDHCGSRPSPDDPLPPMEAGQMKRKTYREHLEDTVKEPIPEDMKKLLEKLEWTR
jgi:hypothetical protein